MTILKALIGVSLWAHATLVLWFKIGCMWVSFSILAYHIKSFIWEYQAILANFFSRNNWPGIGYWKDLKFRPIDYQCQSNTPDCQFTWFCFWSNNYWLSRRPILKYPSWELPGLYCRLCNAYKILFFKNCSLNKLVFDLSIFYHQHVSRLLKFENFNTRHVGYWYPNLASCLGQKAITNQH